MAWLSVIVAAIVAVLYYKHSESIFPSNGGRADGSIFNFTVDQVDDGNPVSLSKYSGKKAYLVVNVASQCGLTDRNYAELQQVYEKYRYESLLLPFGLLTFFQQLSRSRNPRIPM